MSLKMQFWLFFFLRVTIVISPLKTPERELNLSEDIFQDQPQPGQNCSEIGKVNTTRVPYEWSSSGHLIEEVFCVHQQLQLHVLHDILLSLYDDWSKKRELGKVALTQLGICSHSESAQYAQFSSLLMLGQNVLTESNGPGCFQIQKENWEFQEGGTFKTTLHLAKPFKRDQQNTLASIILLFFVDSSNTEELIIKFNSHILQPNKQTVCVSKGTHFLILTGVQPESFNQGHLKLRILVETQTEGQKIGLSEIQAIMERRDPRSNITLNPVFLFFTPRLDNKNAPRSNGTFLFLCELQKFLNEVLPQKNPSMSQNEFATVRPDALHSLPPLILGESSSESLLQELVNSSGPTVFFFSHGSQGLRTHSVELALKPPLLSVLKIRLDEALAQVQMEEAGRKLMDKLQILTVLSALPENGEGWKTGLDNPHEVQYRAVLLLKALQAVLNAWAIDRTQRAARADQEISTRPSECHLQSFTVSLHKFLLQPEMANINNCEGTCGFPLKNGNNHAILLNSHLQSGLSLNRTLCCVPVDYDDLCVIELNSDSTVISYKTNMVAKECGCR